MTFITFIIPTIGRESLKDSIASLQNQTDNDWNAILIFDGSLNQFEFKEKRLTIIEIEKIKNDCNKSCSGFVRNIGLKHIIDNNIETEWIGFLDDDDTISPNYIEKLKEEIDVSPKEFDICIFRMIYPNNVFLPLIQDKNIIKNHVGISFAIHHRIIADAIFENNAFEDFMFLKKMQHKKHRILISSFITYFIRRLPETNDITNGTYPKVSLG